MNEASTEMPAEKWTRTRWLALIALIFAAHIGLIFLSGGKKQIAPRAVKNVPVLKLAGNADELLALDDPTLFVLPHQRDFGSAVWLKKYASPPPDFRYAEPPQPLPLSAEKLGATFQQFMRTNFFAGQPPDFKPAPKFGGSILPVEPAPAQNSTLQIEGGLAQRRLLNETGLPSLPYNDVIAPSRVQALVDAAGNVVSTVRLASSGYDAADQRALQVARSLRFASAPQITLGELTFNWRTVPMTATNTP